MPKLNRLATWLGLGFLSAALALWALPESGDDVHASNGSSPLPVRVARARTEIPTRVVRFAGTVQPKAHAVLAFAVPGRVEDRPVEVGDVVARAAILGELDQGEFRNALSMAQAAVAELDARWSQAERDVTRARELRDLNAATPEELEQVEAVARAVEAAREAALAQVQEARRLLDEATLRAPFSGIVSAVYLEAGEWASPGAPVVELSGTGSLEVEVELPESMAWAFDIGDPVNVELPFRGRELISGRVSSVSRAASGPGRLFPAIVELSDSPLLAPGMTAEVLMEIREPESLTVPFGAVLNPGSSQPTVFCVRNGLARQVPVTLGSLIGDRIAVAGALETGDLVVVAGHTRLADGDGVEIAQEERS